MVKASLLKSPGFRRAIALCMAAGYVDAFGYIALGGVFPANMTGTTVLFGIAVARFDLGRIAVFGMTLSAFFVGAVIASALTRVFKRPVINFTLAAAILVFTSFAGLPGHTELALLACAMGMQGAALSRFAGISLRTVVVTGTMLQFAFALTSRFGHGGNVQQRQPLEIALPAASWLVYGLGAGFGAAASRLLQAPLLVPAILLIATDIDLFLHPKDG